MNEIRYLDRLDLSGPNLMLEHCFWTNEAGFRSWRWRAPMYYTAPQRISNWLRAIHSSPLWTWINLSSLFVESVPSPINQPSGCSFHPRCRYAEAICKNERPEWREIEEGHFVACHLAEKLNLLGVDSYLNVNY